MNCKSSFIRLKCYCLRHYWGELGAGGDLCDAEGPFWAYPRASEVEGVNGLNIITFFLDTWNSCLLIRRKLTFTRHYSFHFQNKISYSVLASSPNLPSFLAWGSFGLSIFPSDFLSVFLFMVSGWDLCGVCKQLFKPWLSRSCDSYS